MKNDRKREEQREKRLETRLKDKERQGNVSAGVTLRGREG